MPQMKGVMVSKFLDKPFWADTVDRAVATFAQAALAALGSGAAGILSIDVVSVLSVAGLAALTSVLSSVAFRGGGQQAG